MNGDGWTFFRAFLRSPQVVASVIPSSQRLERRVVSAACAARAQVLVELGPGTGGISRALLAAMQRESRLLAIERTAEFVDRLRGMDDKRFDVVNGCASAILELLRERGMRQADAIVSGIPFSTLPGDLARTIVDSVADALAPGGRFVAYQVVAAVTEYANPALGTPAVEFELFNVPPTRVFIWQKRCAAHDS